MIAEIADAHLGPNARAEVNRLLALEPGASLATVASWADEVRDPATAAWHYVNFPRDADCQFDADRMCVQGNCVVDAIERQAAVLRSSAPDEQRLKALKYLVHFVGDVHQPLHAGFADDRGGNSFQLQAFGKGTNLHAVWDSGLIANWPGGTEALKVAVHAAYDPSSEETGPRVWAASSCRIASAPGFYPDGRSLKEGYLTQWEVVLPRQLAAASARLAALLESALGTR